MTRFASMTVGIEFATGPARSPRGRGYIAISLPHPDRQAVQIRGPQALKGPVRFRRQTLLAPAMRSLTP